MWKLIRIYVEFNKNLPCQVSKKSIIPYPSVSEIFGLSLKNFWKFQFDLILYTFL